MLVNVKFFKIFIFFLLLSANLSAGEKNQIITQLNNLNSLEFTFDQTVNDKTEKGSCLLEFPGKLKCDYFDDKKKELIINKKKLAITQKRYNKTYYYPISKSPFLNILKNFTFTNMICFTDNTFFFHHINNSSCSIIANL